MHIFIKDDRTNQNYLLNNQIIDDYFKNNNILNKIYDSRLLIIFVSRLFVLKKITNFL